MLKENHEGLPDAALWQAGAKDAKKTRKFYNEKTQENSKI